MEQDIEQTLAAGKDQFRPICWTSARLRREEPVLGWMPSRMKIRRAEFIRENFFPVKEHPARFHRFDAVWTPTVLLLESDGKKRVRLEGYSTQ